MKLIYPGPHDEVVVPAFGNLTASRGVPVEVDDKTQAEQLLAQGWTKAARSAKEDAER